MFKSQFKIKSDSNICSGEFLKTSILSLPKGLPLIKLDIIMRLSMKVALKWPTYFIIPHWLGNLISNESALQYF